jgi:hypothetical protein
MLLVVTTYFHHLVVVRLTKTGFWIGHWAYWTLTPLKILNYNLQWRSRQFSITFYIVFSLFQNYSLQSTITTHFVLLDWCPTPILWFRLPTATLSYNAFSILWNCLLLSRFVLYGALSVTDSCCPVSFTNFRISGL